MKISIFTISSALMKICQIAHVVFQTYFHVIFLQILITLQCQELYSSVIFLGQTLYILHRGNNQSANFLDFLELGSKFTKFLSLLKQKISFSSNCVPLIGIMMYNSPTFFFSWNFIYFQQKQPIKVQIWWNFTWAVESLKCCTLVE